MTRLDVDSEISAVSTQNISRRIHGVIFVHALCGHARGICRPTTSRQPMCGSSGSAERNEAQSWYRESGCLGKPPLGD